MGELAGQTQSYPFLQQLKPALERLDDILAKPYTWYLTELTREVDALLDRKEGLIDPIRKFMSGPQRGIYDDAKRYLDAQEANFSYIQDDTSGELRNALYDPQCFKGDRMQQLKTKLDALKQAVTSELDKTRKQANAMLDQMQQRMQTMDEYKALPEARTDELNAKFQELRSHFAQQRLIAVINALLRRFEEQGYQTLLRRMVEMAKPKPTHTDTSIGGKTSPGIKETKAEYVSARKLSIPFDKPLLRDSADVDRYVEALRQALLKEIGEGKQVQV